MNQVRLVAFSRVYVVGSGFSWLGQTDPSRSEVLNRSGSQDLERGQQTDGNGNEPAVS